MHPISKILIGAGALLILAGIYWQFGTRLFGGLPIGKLPGDISIERPNFRFYFPLMTSLVVSVVISLLIFVFRRFFR